MRWIHTHTHSLSIVSAAVQCFFFFGDSIDFPHFFFFSLTWKLKKIFSFCSKRDSLLFALFDKKSKKVKNRKKFGLPHPSIHVYSSFIILFLFLCVRDFKHQTPPKKRIERKGARAYYCNNTRTPKMSLIASSHRAFVQTLSAKHNIVAKGLESTSTSVTCMCSGSWVGG